MLEAAGTVGGAAVTDEFLPGFRNSAASYTVSLLNPKVIRDLELERHALKVVLGKTDRHGAYATQRPVAPADVICTILDSLGIDPRKQLRTPDGRPVEILDKGELVGELFA